MKDQLKNLGLQIMNSHSFELLMGRTNVLFPAWYLDVEIDDRAIRTHAELAVFEKLFDLEHLAQSLTKGFIPEDLINGRSGEPGSVDEQDINADVPDFLPSSTPRKNVRNSSFNPIESRNSRIAANQYQASESLYDPGERQTSNLYGKFSSQDRKADRNSEEYFTQENRQSLGTTNDRLANDGEELTKSMNGLKDNSLINQRKRNASKSSGNTTTPKKPSDSEVEQSPVNTPDSNTATFRSFKPLSELGKKIQNKKGSIQDSSSNGRDGFLSEIKRSTKHPQLAISENQKKLDDLPINEASKELAQMVRKISTSSRANIIETSDSSISKGLHIEGKPKEENNNSLKIIPEFFSTGQTENRIMKDSIEHEEAETTGGFLSWREDLETDVDDIIDTLTQHLNEEYKRFYGPI